MAAAQDLKRAREEHELAADEAPAKRAKGPEQTPLLSVPAMGDSIEASTLLPVVQQLLSVYKVRAGLYAAAAAAADTSASAVAAAANTYLPHYIMFSGGVLGAVRRTPCEKARVL